MVETNVGYVTDAPFYVAVGRHAEGRASMIVAFCVVSSPGILRGQNIEFRRSEIPYSFFIQEGFGVSLPSLASIYWSSSNLTKALSSIPVGDEPGALEQIPGTTKTNLSI